MANTAKWIQCSEHFSYLWSWYHLSRGSGVVTSGPGTICLVAQSPPPTINLSHQIKAQCPTCWSGPPTVRVCVVTTDPAFWKWHKSHQWLWKGRDRSYTSRILVGVQDPPVRHVKHSWLHDCKCHGTCQKLHVTMSVCFSRILPS